MFPYHAPEFRCKGLFRSKAIYALCHLVNLSDIATGKTAAVVGCSITIGIALASALWSYAFDRRKRISDQWQALAMTKIYHGNEVDRVMMELSAIMTKAGAGK